MSGNSILVYYFSGTGNTKHVVDVFAQQAAGRGLSVVLSQLSAGDVPEPPDLFGLMYPLYGGGSPGNIVRWLKSLPPGRGQRCFVVTNGAGAEHPINGGAMNRPLRVLRRRGYRADYSRVLAMPSNWLIATPSAVGRHFLDLLPQKCDSVLDELEAGRKRHPRRRPLYHFFTALLAAGEEGMGARFWGRFLRVSQDCSGCGKCIRDCTVGNISPGTASAGKGAVRFGWRCIWCMKCIYQCPGQAIEPRFLKSAALKGGYNIDFYMDDRAAGSDFDLDGYTARRRWLRDYLNQPSA